MWRMSSTFLKKEEIIVNQYQFEQIARVMEKHYGKIKKGEEDIHAMVLFPMESNLLKIHRKYPDSNSRRLREAILLVLHRVNGYLKHENIDVEKFENEDNVRLRDALLMSFDPFTNADINDILTLQGGMDFSDDKKLDEYLKEPVLCMMRILDSVDHWEKQGGIDGYFDFMESWMDDKIPQNEDMDYSIMVDGETISGIIED